MKKRSVPWDGSDEVALGILTKPVTAILGWQITPQMAKDIHGKRGSKARVILLEGLRPPQKAEVSLFKVSRGFSLYPKGS